MNYHWTNCPSCSCQVAVNWSVRGEGVTGSLRRWSTDRSINDGRPFVVPGAQVGADLTALCVCGAPIPLPDRPDAVGGERSDDLRVTLTTGD
ncbi:MAG TPA: hypothetical protein VGS98_14020 [Thermoanaerobaculia bacterium]|jgi:hypothetical protein|nr:hypothetical protein [Thermoanaerobaculia bacterium]